MKVPETPEEIAEHIKWLAETEIIIAVTKGALSVDKLTDIGFRYGVCFGILIATKQIHESIPEHLRSIVRKTWEEHLNRHNN